MREKIILKIGFSPCPNDTFIFDALVNKKMDTGNLHFEPVLEDVQTLNNWALLGKLPVTKLSYGVLPLVASKYKLPRHIFYFLWLFLKQSIKSLCGMMR